MQLSAFVQDADDEAGKKGHSPTHRNKGRESAESQIKGKVE